MVPSPSSPESPFINSPRDTVIAEGPGVSGDRAVPTTSVLSAPTADNLEGGSSAESAIASDQRAPPSLQSDGNRLIPTAFNAPSREASVPPIMANATYGGAPYYGSMQPRGSSTESSVVSKHRTAPSLQVDDNRLTPTTFNAPSREPSVPPILVNAAYGGAPSYYGSMQPQPSLASSDPTYFRPQAPSPNPLSVPLGTAEAPNSLQGPAAASDAAHNMAYRHGGPYGHYLMHRPGPWSNFHVDPSYVNTSPIPSMQSLAPDNTMVTYGGVPILLPPPQPPQSLDVPGSFTSLDRRPLPIEPRVASIPSHPSSPLPTPSDSLAEPRDDIPEDAQAPGRPWYLNLTPPQGSIDRKGIEMANDSSLSPLSPPPPIATLPSFLAASTAQPSSNMSSPSHPGELELSNGTGDSVVGSSGIQKPNTGGRPSNESLGYIATAFQKVNEIWLDLSQMTGKSVTELRRRYEKSAKGASEHRNWNTYLKYFANNVAKESQRLNRPYDNTQEFRAACYAQYKSDVPDWQKALDAIFELEFSNEEKTIGQRKKEYEKYEKKINDLVCTLYLVSFISILIRTTS
jgi:hypothetical protein